MQRILVGSIFYASSVPCSVAKGIDSHRGIQEHQSGLGTLEPLTDTSVETHPQKEWYAGCNCRIPLGKVLLWDSIEAVCGISWTSLASTWHSETKILLTSGSLSHLLLWSEQVPAHSWHHWAVSSRVKAGTWWRNWWTEEARLGVH